MSLSSPDAHPLDPLNQVEIKAAASAIREKLSAVTELRFVAISLSEPPKLALLEFFSTSKPLPRRAEALVLDCSTGIASQIYVSYSSPEAATVDEITSLPAGVQPLLTPDDCFLAEEIVKSNSTIQQVMKERYGITNIEVELACDPWSVHLASEEDRELAFNSSTKQPRRLVQTFLYQRTLGPDDNHYAHPIDVVPIVDLNTKELVKIDGIERSPPPKVPKDSVNYHRNLLNANSYLQASWRAERLAPLDVVQPEGPSFKVKGNSVEWQKWSFRVGFNYREGLVLHDVRYGGRTILHRGSLVEMAVPYGDPHPPFQRKCAFDVGDYGLGYCANSLELGCDCLGHIHYFDATLVNAQGEPVKRPKVVCLHEEDAGIIWKHFDYRSEHNESRRARELIISSIATVVNYEYLFYWKLKQDGTIDFQIKLSGELSTNLLSHGEGTPSDGVLVAPGVNAQIHQHMFCARLDLAVDGYHNTVSEIDFVSIPDENPYGNRFGIRETVFETEQEAIRTGDSTKARSWRVASEDTANPISGKKRSYKLIPFTMGPAQPTLLTNAQCEVSKKGAFARANLWVTQYSDKERFPAGECTPQGDGSGGLPEWTTANRSVKGQDVVLWHSFGVCHMPRVEDFPVMPCEVTGFMLKPDGFFDGNPAVDLEPDMNAASKLASGCCAKE